MEVRGTLHTDEVAVADVAEMGTDAVETREQPDPRRAAEAIAYLFAVCQGQDVEEPASLSAEARARCRRLLASEHGRSALLNLYIELWRERLLDHAG
jgi:hypothetical protein